MGLFVVTFARKKRELKGENFDGLFKSHLKFKYIDWKKGKISSNKIPETSAKPEPEEIEVPDSLKKHSKVITLLSQEYTVEEICRFLDLTQREFQRIKMELIEYYANLPTVS